MKTNLKSRLINVLKTDVKKFNRYIRFSMSFDIEFKVNLSDSDLSDSNLSGSNLRYSDLSGSNLDFSCLSLSCKSLFFKSDIRIRTQIAFHFASLIANAENTTDEEKKIYSDILGYVNKFHRTDVSKLNKL